MMKLFICFLFFLAVGVLSVEDTWSEFKKIYSREYKSLREENLRYEIFKSKLQIVNEHNKRYKNGEESYVMGINQFSDLTKEEFRKFLGHKKPEIDFSGQFDVPVNYTEPTSIDWRSKGAVLSVKEQGPCGCCYAFSAIGAIEGQRAIKHGIKEDLSEQELVDCSDTFHNGGCDGGDMISSFQYIKAEGISTAKTYPYKQKKNKCSRSGKTRANVKVTGYKSLAPTETALQAAVASIGPISIGIDADKIEQYRTGIFDNDKCGNVLNHAVLVVGYGTENGKDYWLIKNSWGTVWGDNGYIKVRRNKNKQCGIGIESSYPIIS